MTKTERMEQARTPSTHSLELDQLHDSGSSHGNRRTLYRMHTSVADNDESDSDVLNLDMSESKADATNGDAGDKRGDSTSSLSPDKFDEECLSEPSVDNNDQREFVVNTSKSKYLCRTKTTFFFILVCIAAGTSILVWHFLRTSEEDECNMYYEASSSKVLNYFIESMDNGLSAAYALASVYTSRYAANDEQKDSDTNTNSWPNITMPHFGAQSMNTKIGAKAESVIFSPIVKEELYESWSSYAIKVKNEDQENIFEPDDIFAHPYHLPIWQQNPKPSNTDGPFNLYSESRRQEAIDEMMEHQITTITSFIVDEDGEEPHSLLFVPIFRSFANTEVVGTIGVDFIWSRKIVNPMPNHIGGLCIVLECSNGQQFTFEFNGVETTFLGEGDLHETKYDDKLLITPYNIPNFDSYMMGYDLNGVDPNNTGGKTQSTTYTIRIYPSTVFEEECKSSQPAIAATMVAVGFLFVLIPIALYLVIFTSCNPTSDSTKTAATGKSTSIVIADGLTNGHHNVESNRSNRSSKPRQRSIVQTIPKQGPKRSLRGKMKRRSSSQLSVLETRSNYRLKKFLTFDAQKFASTRDLSFFSGEPIANLFPKTTVLFADIAGFSAWSSEREPSQVFELLEATYREFDLEAKKRGVFKVETVGDCYVAATGIPDAQEDHAVIMVEYARWCVGKFQELTKELELSLGPGTSLLGMRIGVHSGSVVGGVLRDEKGRFQLMGDTMNTANRMEATGKKNLIHVSPETSELLKAAGNGSWLVARTETIAAIGKGKIQTFWVSQSSMERPRQKRHSNSTHESVDFERRAMQRLSFLESTQSREDIMMRSVHWTVAVLEDLLIKVMQHRQKYPDVIEAKLHRQNSGLMVIEEITDRVTFIPYRPMAAETDHEGEEVHSIGQEAKEELIDYVTRIAKNYRNVHFHNFEHASHVTMSANKLMKKVCASNWAGHDSEMAGEDETTRRHLFFKTFGISSDPLAQFAVVFAALVHDVDHVGLPNVELINENPEFAAKYNNKSVAEQNSICFAWDLLMQPEFSNLRTCMFSSNNDKRRFRQLLIHMIIATDIADRERMKQEKERWNRAFTNIATWGDAWRGKARDELEKIDVSFMATAVLEQLVLASDIAHTMQHWKVFILWNEKLFKERMAAFIEGRSEVDPRGNWYESEIGFFDFYIIPLATRLKDCGVFGTAGDEYLGYALQNRLEWIEKGKGIVEEYLEWAEMELEYAEDAVDATDNESTQSFA